VVTAIGDEEVAGAVHRYTRGIVQPGSDRGTAISTEACLSGACDSGDGSRGIHPAYSLVPGVGDKQVSGVIYRQAGRSVQPRLGRRAVVADAASR